MASHKISAIAQRLWDLNENKLTRNVDYRLDLQEPYRRQQSHPHRRGDDDEDEAVDDEKRPLISINVQNFIRRPTFRTFLSLFDNYEPDTDTPEYEDLEEVAEQRRFLNACMKTPLMKEAHRFLVGEGKAPHDENEFKEMLHDIWFEFYSRTPDERVESSSAFEHVFIGERKGNKKVLGCHNWLDYYYLQRKGAVSYLGYVPSGTIYEDIETDDPAVVAFAFILDGVLKPMGGFLIGLSPEFELALYTIIFLCGRQKTRVQFANLDVEFDCYKMQREGRQVIGTLFPTLDNIPRDDE